MFIRHAAIPLAFVVLTSGCASSAPSASGSAPAQTATPSQATIYQGSDRVTMYSDAARSSDRTFDADPAKVWAAVKQTFADYSIPVTVENAATRQIGNPDFFRTRSFMGKNMTDLVSCGSSMTGPNAATFRIFMSLTVNTAPAGTGKTKTGVTFVASARDMSGGNSVDRLPCGSTGIVDQLFLDQITKNLSK
jgi:hypothetical protein